jgi:hypothetical protein
MKLGLFEWKCMLKKQNILEVSVKSGKDEVSITSLSDNEVTLKSNGKEITVDIHDLFRVLHLFLD